MCGDPAGFISHNRSSNIRSNGNDVDEESAHPSRRWTNPGGFRDSAVVDIVDIVLLKNKRHHHEKTMDRTRPTAAVQ
jgi:hypothetical protein